MNGKYLPYMEGVLAFGRGVLALRPGCVLVLRVAVAQERVDFAVRRPLGDARARAPRGVAALPAVEVPREERAVVQRLSRQPQRQQHVGHLCEQEA